MFSAPADSEAVVKASAIIVGVTISDLNVAALGSTIAASVSIFGVSPAQVNITSVSSARRLLGTSSSGSGAAPRALSGGGAVLVAFTIEGSASVMEAVAVSLAALLEAPAFVAAYAVRTGGTQLTVTSVQAVLVLGGPAVTGQSHVGALSQLQPAA